MLMYFVVWSMFAFFSCFFLGSYVAANSKTSSNDARVSFAQTTGLFAIAMAILACALTWLYSK